MTLDELDYEYNQRRNAIIEELEKIKEEILDKVSMYENDFLIEPHFVEEVINKRISELKGQDEYEPDDWDSLANAERDH